MKNARYCLIIGNCNYQSPKLSNFNNRLEITRLDEMLRDDRVGQFYSKLLINKGLPYIKSRIQHMCNSLDKGDTILIYFNGHGFKDDFNNLYFGVNTTDIGKLETTALSAHFIKDMLRKSKAKKQILILDCCFSGAYNDINNYKSNIEEDFDNIIEKGIGNVVLTSSSSIQYSYTSNPKNSIGEESYYTKYMLEGIETGAADLYKDGQITAHELHLYIRKKMLKNKVPQSPRINNENSEIDIIIAKNSSNIGDIILLNDDVLISNNKDSIKKSALTDSYDLFLKLGRIGFILLLSPAIFLLLFFLVKIPLLYSLLIAIIIIPISYFLTN